MQMVMGCGREIAGMAKNHINRHHRVAMCGKLFLNPMLHLGPQKQWSQKFLKSSGSTPTLCLDKAVLAQGGGGVVQNCPPHSGRVSVCCHGGPYRTYPHPLLGMPTITWAQPVPSCQ